MKLRPAHAIVPLALIAAVVIPLAALREPPKGMGQTVPPGGGPVTTPQPTVPCTPVSGCGRGAPNQVDFVWAYLLRFCDGSAVPTPPGFTTFALVYGNGILATTTASFTGSATKNGVALPTNPLQTLVPGERDLRIRQGVVQDGDIFTVTLTAVDPAGNPRLFGDGSTVKTLSASGSCPQVTPLAPSIPTPSVSLPTPTGPAPTLPPVTASVPPGPFGFPRSL